MTTTGAGQLLALDEGRNSTTCILTTYKKPDAVTNTSTLFLTCNTSQCTQPVRHTTGTAHNRCGTQPVRHTTGAAHNQYDTQTVRHTTGTAHNRYGTQPVRHTNSTTHNRYGTQPVWHTTCTTHNQYDTQPVRHTTGTTHNQWGLYSTFNMGLYGASNILTEHHRGLRREWCTLCLS